MFPPTFPVQLRHWLATSVLPDYLRRSRWFGAGGEDAGSVTFLDTVPVDSQTVLLLLQTGGSGGAPAIYQVPLALVPESSNPEPVSVITRWEGLVVMDALYSASFREALWQRILPGAGAAPDSRVLNVEQSHSAVLYGDEVFLKLYRRIEPGPHPEREILEFLSAAEPRPAVPSWRGALDWKMPSGESVQLALATSAVAHQGTAWEVFTAWLRDFLQKAGESDQPEPWVVAHFWNSQFPERLTRLGQSIAGLHLALARSAAHPAFCPEAFTTEDLHSAQASIRPLWHQVSHTVPDPAMAARVGQIVARPPAMNEPEMALTKIRTHGDLHLGQVLVAGSDFVLVDFEGEPARSTAWRRRRQSPLRDVAGMLRSLHYAACHAGRLTSCAAAVPEIWTRLASDVFLSVWSRETVGASFVPRSPGALQALLQLFLVEKVLYEIHYEAGHRPDWLPVPLRGLRFVLDQHP